MKITNETRPVLESMPSAVAAGGSVWKPRQKLTQTEGNRYATRIRRVWKRRGWETPVNWQGRGRRVMYA